MFFKFGIISLFTYLGSLIFGLGVIEALIMAALGLILGCIGMDPISSHFRFTFGIISLVNGIDIPILAMGLFGISEILLNVEKKEGVAEYVKTSTKLRDLLPNALGCRRDVPFTGVRQTRNYAGPICLPLHSDPQTTKRLEAPARKAR
jgi:TctA family transporter